MPSRLAQRFIVGLIPVSIGMSAALPAAGPDPSDPVAGRSHWAFRPLGEKRLPFPIGENWSRSWIVGSPGTELEFAL